LVEAGARPDPQEIVLGSERVIRSDVGEAHRLSLSARVLSAQDSQVKAKNRSGRSTSDAVRNGAQAICKASRNRCAGWAKAPSPRLKTRRIEPVSGRASSRERRHITADIGNANVLDQQFAESAKNLILPGYY